MRKQIVLFLLMITFWCPFYAWSQTGKRVTGVVKDFESSEPVQGATILAKGGSGSSVTADENGAFSINLPETINTLSVSGVGYAPLDVDITGKTTVTVNLTR
ncbi:MAG: carboxypeptidase-like regulatory domain-containing protein, partial [Niabella sp.]